MNKWIGSVIVPFEASHYLWAFLLSLFGFFVIFFSFQMSLPFYSFLLKQLSLDSSWWEEIKKNWALIPCDLTCSSSVLTTYLIKASAFLAILSFPCEICEQQKIAAHFSYVYHLEWIHEEMVFMFRVLKITQTSQNYCQREWKWQALRRFRKNDTHNRSQISTLPVHKILIFWRLLNS